MMIPFSGSKNKWPLSGLVIPSAFVLRHLRCVLNKIVDKNLTAESGRSSTLYHDG